MFLLKWKQFKLISDKDLLSCFTYNLPPAFTLYRIGTLEGIVRTDSIERVKDIRKGMFNNTVLLIAEAALYNTARVRVKITYRNYKLSISYPTVQHKH